VGYGTFYRYFASKGAQVANEVCTDIFAQATSDTSSPRPRVAGIDERAIDEVMERTVADGNDG